MTVSASVRERWSSISTNVGDLKSDRVVAVLEQQILSGAFAPGTTLPIESELCEILGVSRTVLRDAVRALVARGLLTVRQGRGTVVPEPTDEAFANAMVALLSRSALTMGEVMEARATIETLLVRLAADAGTEEDWEDLERAHHALGDAVAMSDEMAASSAHATFHARILQATHQPALTLMLTPMNKVALFTGAASVRRGSMEDWDVEAHRSILDALKLRDAEAAEAAMREHFAVLARSTVYQELLDRPFAKAYFNQSSE